MNDIIDTLAERIAQRLCDHNTAPPEPPPPLTGGFRQSRPWIPDPLQPLVERYGEYQRFDAQDWRPWRLKSGPNQGEAVEKNIRTGHIRRDHPHERPASAPDEPAGPDAPLPGHDTIPNARPGPDKGWAARQAGRPKELRAAGRFRDSARRRRVIHAVRNEGEFSRAVGAVNEPDSLPPDVTHVIDAAGKVISDPQTVRHVMRMRGAAIKELAGEGISPQRKETLERFLSGQRLMFYEVKTLLTSPSGTVRMSAAAVARKRAWEKKYGGTFHTVVFDDRRGQKHSGNRLYYRAGVGSVSLAKMQAVGDFQELVSRAYQSKG